MATDESLMPLNCTNERERFNQATCERYAPRFLSDRSTCFKDGEIVENVRVPVPRQLHLEIEYNNTSNQENYYQLSNHRSPTLPNFFPSNFLQLDSTISKEASAIYCETNNL